MRMTRKMQAALYWARRRRLEMLEGGGDAIDDILAAYPTAQALVIRDFDPARKINSIDRLYTSVTGQTPVIALADLIGIVIEESKDAVLGSELSAPFVSSGAGWTVTGADATHIVTFGDGSARYQADTLTPNLTINRSVANITIGKHYEVTVVVSSYTSGTLRLLGFHSILIPTAVGTYTYRAVASSGTISIDRNSTNVDVTLGSISVKEILGNHANQTTGGARGFLQNGYHPGLLGSPTELITNGTFDTDTSGWTISASHAASIVSGKMRLVASATGFTYQSFPTIVGKTYLAKGVLTNIAGANFKAIRKSDTSNASLNVVDITISGTNQITFVATATTTYIVCQINNTDTVDFDDISVQEIPDAAVRKVWRGDGVDDNLLTLWSPAAGATMIIACDIKSVSDHLIGASTDGSTGQFSLEVSAAGRILGRVGTIAPAFTTGDDRFRPIVAAIRCNGTTASIFRKDFIGTIEKVDIAQVGTPTTTVPIRIGSRNTGGSNTAPFVGDAYSVFAIQAELTDAEVETVMNQFSQ